MIVMVKGYNLQYVHDISTYYLLLKEGWRPL